MSEPVSKMFNHDKTTGHDEWLTPPDITNVLGPFDLDPCSPVVRPWSTAKKHLTIEDDGLTKNWDGFVYLNPPYGKNTYSWMKKLKQYGNGIALIFARTETKTWFDLIWNGATSVYFIKGRLSFFDVAGNKSGPAGAPSVLVAYGEEADARLRDYAGLPGIYINLKQGETRA